MAPFIIIADRGGLKAYRVEEAGGRGRAARLVDSHRVEDARGRYQDKFTDQAGAFPSGTSAGTANATAERMGLEAENEMRSFRHIAGRMAELLREHRPERWAFAAPAEINGAILDGLPADLKEHLTANIGRDLINVPAAGLLEHFS